jgi:hypothetical protein
LVRHGCSRNVDSAAEQRRARPRPSWLTRSAGGGSRQCGSAATPARALGLTRCAFLKTECVDPTRYVTIAYDPWPRSSHGGHTSTLIRCLACPHKPIQCFCAARPSDNLRVALRM